MADGIELKRAIALSQGSTERGGWLLARAAPDRRLKPHVRAYTGYVERGGQPLRRREIPVCHIPFILNFGAPFHIVEARTNARTDRLDSFIAGLSQSYTLVESDGDNRCIQIDFSPLGAYRLLSLPMCELSERTPAAGELLGAGFDRLLSQLDEARDWAARFALLDRFLLARLAARPASFEPTAWAYRQLEASRGQMRIGEIADALGWSRKRMLSAFREHVGLPPKLLARIFRFNHAAERLAANADGSGAGIAAACGYVDQAHMIRDFQAFAGMTPGAFAVATGAGGLIEPAGTFLQS